MARNVIQLLGQPLLNEDGVAAEAIMPGHIVEGVTSISKNTGNAVKVAMTIALERDEMGKGIDVAYAVGDTVKIGSFAPGMRAYLWLPSGQNISAGQYLEADNAGRLVAISSGVRLGRALEAVNANTGDARIRVEIV